MGWKKGVWIFVEFSVVLDGSGGTVIIVFNPFPTFPSIGL